jgi:hypothetical protein
MAAASASPDERRMRGTGVRRRADCSTWLSSPPICTTPTTPALPSIGTRK